MTIAQNISKKKYRVVLIESSLPHSYSGKIDVAMEENNTMCFIVYNNHALYRRLTKAIEKYFS